MILYFEIQYITYTVYYIYCYSKLCKNIGACLIHIQ